MHITLKLAAFVLAGATLLPSCSSESLELPQEELYARAFIKEFGLVKPSNPFNIATKSNVKVVTQSPTRVKITAVVDGREYLFADYSAVDGSQDIFFDLPKGVTDIFVRANGKKIPAKTGATVDLRSRASRAEGGEKYFCNNRISFFESEPKIFESIDVYDIIRVLPEEQPNTHNEEVFSDFYFAANAGDEMTFYPLFWNTSSCHSLGIYWLSDDGEFHWYDLDNNGKPTGTEKTVDNKKDAVMNSYMQDLYRSRSGLLKYSSNYDKNNPESATWSTIPSGQQCSFPGISGNELPNHAENVAFKATGITLKFHDNIKFGFFLKVKGGYNPLTVNEDGYVEDYSHIFFSQARRNQYYGRVFCSNNIYYLKDNVTERIEGQSLKYYAPDGNELYSWQAASDGFNQTAWNIQQWGSDASSNFIKGITNYSRAAYTTVPLKDQNGNIIRDRSYFAFEDWSNGPIDLNDLIFIMDDSTVETYDGDDKPIDPENPDDPGIPAYEWIIAAEDLGNTYDWDFNDMVVAVSYVATDNPAKKEIKVRPLAAGGTLPVYLMFDNPATGKTEMIGNELHNWLGGATNAPINVGENGEEKSGTAATIEWSGTDDFSLASHLDKTGLSETVTNMGGFWLLVDREGKYNSSSDFSNVKNDDDSQAVTPNLIKGDSYSPQMICLGGQWCWPQEEHPIHEVYVGFKGWLNDPETVGAKWYGADADFDQTRVVTRSSLTNP